MTANVQLEWENVEFKASEVTNWRTLKKVVDVASYIKLTSERAVYVIRICKP